MLAEQPTKPASPPCPAPDFFSGAAPGAAASPPQAEETRASCRCRCKRRRPHPCCRKTKGSWLPACRATALVWKKDAPRAPEAWKLRRQGDHDMRHATYLHRRGLHKALAGSNSANFRAQTIEVGKEGAHEYGGGGALAGRQHLCQRCKSKLHAYYILMQGSNALLAAYKPRMRYSSTTSGPY